MDEKSVKKLKSKFVLVASLSFLMVMLFISGFIYLFNHWVTESDANETLSLILENNGTLPAQKQPDDIDEKAGLDIMAEIAEDDRTEAAEEAGTESSPEVSTELSTEGSSDTDTSEESGTAATGAQPSTVVENMFYLGRGFLSTESTYSTRYFSVVFDADASVKTVNTGHIASVNRDQAVGFGRLIYNGRKSFGRIGDYYYKKQVKDDGMTIVVILDYTERIRAGKRLLNFVLILIGFGMLVSILIMRGLAGRVVRGEIRNIENQKSFITNASHELKTPLAVIKANTEITELTSGETEWTQSTLRQVDRMTGLIQNLVMITRAQEKDSHAEFVQVDVSKAVKETAETFESVATQDGKTIEQDIPEGIIMSGEEGEIRQLTSLLMDNAIKYCDDRGTIRVSLQKKGRSGVRLVVSNNYAEGKNVDYTRFFERFYREDKSHNQDKGGYGIGLSIAENICGHYHGSIRANWADGIISFICILG